ncbi:hypothetical protein PRIPAC_83948, partial [Pristionchus pacificus]
RVVPSLRALFLLSAMVKTINIGGVEEHLPDEHAQYEEVFTAAGDVMKHALDVLNDPDFEEKKGGWKPDCSSDDVTIHYKDNSSGRYFAGRCKIKVSAKDMNTEFWDHLDRNHEWNDNIKQARRVKKLSDNTDYFHYTSNDVFIIKSREVVAARAMREIDGAYILACRSVSLPKEIPELKGSVRAHLHISVSRVRPDPDDPAHSCIYDYVICTDLKGMMFRSAVNQVLGRATMKDIENIRVHANTVLRPQLYPGLK